MKPRCYNRNEFEGKWILVALRGPNAKPHYRWRPFVFEQRCAAWDAPNINDSAPARGGWDCEGCRWCPKEAMTLLLQRRSAKTLVMGKQVWIGPGDLGGMVPVDIPQRVDPNSRAGFMLRQMDAITVPFDAKQHLTPEGQPDAAIADLYRTPGDKL
jgi:hypothetical protein